MEVRSEIIGMVYGVGSKILAVQVTNGKPKVVNGEIDSIDQTTNSFSIKDSQSGLIKRINTEEIKSIEITEEVLTDSVAISRWFKHPDDTFQMHPAPAPAPAPAPVLSLRPHPVLSNKPIVDGISIAQQHMDTEILIAQINALSQKKLIIIYFSD